MTAAQQMVLTVTPNPALDETYALSGLVPGGSHRVPPPAVRAGGKGINAARVAHQLGYPVLAITTAGGATGAAFGQELAASGLPSRTVAVEAPTRRSMAFVDSGSGLTSIFNESGSRLTGREWDQLNGVIQDALPGAGCVVGAGSLPPAAPEDFYAELVRRAAARRLPCIIDTSGPGLLRAAGAGAFLLKPNREELAEATGCAGLERGAAVLLEAGAGYVCVSAGAEGMWLFSAADPGRPLSAGLGRGLAGNPTGAGDAAVAAIAVLLAAGLREPRRLLRAATAWSAAAVLMPAAGEISPRFSELSAEITITEHHRRAAAPKESR